MRTGYSLAQVAKSTGLPTRTIQFWTVEGVLNATGDSQRRGPGKHRRYSFDEIKIAAVLAEIQNFQLRVGALISVSEYLRDIFKAGDELGFEDPGHAERHLDDHYSKRKKSGLKDRDRIRLSQWAAFETSKKMDGRATVLGIYINDDGECTAEVFAGDVTDPKQPGRFGELLLNNRSGLVISIGDVLYELEGRMIGLGMIDT